MDEPKKAKAPYVKDGGIFGRRKEVDSDKETERRQRGSCSGNLWTYIAGCNFDEPLGYLPSASATSATASSAPATSSSASESGTSGTVKAKCTATAAATKTAGTTTAAATKTERTATAAEPEDLLEV
jgi:hypothetical protein